MNLIHTFGGDGPYALTMQYAADGQYLISAGMNRHLHLWSTQDWSHVRQIGGHAKSVNALVLHRAGTLVASGSSDCSVRIWSFPEFALLHELQDRRKVVAGLAVAHRKDLLAACSYGGRVAVWDFDGALRAAFKVSSRNLSTVAFAPRDDMILAGGLGGELTLWSLPEGKPAGRIEAHAIAVGYCRYLPDQRRVLTLGYDGRLKLWDSRNWTLMRSACLHEDRITGFWWDRERERALVLSAGLIRLFDLAHWTFVDELAVDSRVLTCGTVSPDGTTAVIGSADAKFRIIALD